MNAIDIFITTFLRVLTYWVLGFILLGLIGFLMGCTEKRYTNYDECFMKESQKFGSDYAFRVNFNYRENFGKNRIDKYCMDYDY